MSLLVTYSISADIVAGTVNLESLHTSVNDSALVTGFTGIRRDTDDLHIFGTSIADVNALDTLIADHDAEPLAELKARRYQEIDERTGELIAAGFTYDSVVFSLSANAQTNWIGLKQAADLALLTYPFGVSTKADAEYFLDDDTDVNNFYATGLGTKVAHLASGRALRNQIIAATTKAEVDAIVDER